MDDSLTHPIPEDIESLQKLVKAYRVWVPRLQEQTAEARREAAGMAPKRVPCPAESRSGMLCQLDSGHPGPHFHRGDTVEWSWGP